MEDMVNNFFDTYEDGFLEYLEAHKQHLANLEKQLEEGAIYGEHYAEHFIPTIEVLKFIIERLEGLQNGN